MNIHLKSIARILDSDNRIVGLGFQMPDRRILTYTHVVEAALGVKCDSIAAPPSPLSLDFPHIEPGKTFKAKLVFWRPNTSCPSMALCAADDVAMLELVNFHPAAPHEPSKIDGQHFNDVINQIIEGRVVPFLGAGASLVGRPNGISWAKAKHLPSGAELAEYLASRFRYLLTDLNDLLAVSQYIDSRLGPEALKYELHELFNADYLLTDLHYFFANLPRVLKSKGCDKPYQLILTTNYDDLLERAFASPSIEEPYDLLTYIADGENQGKFLHRRYNGKLIDGKLADGNEPDMADGEVRVIDKPNQCSHISTKNRTVILKIHGAVDRKEKERDSYVITEEHYIDYLSRADIFTLLPALLAAHIKTSHLLFLGYSLRDWNLRVILHRLSNGKRLPRTSWSVQLHPGDLDKTNWSRRGVDILNADLEDYIKQLDERIRGL